MDQTAEPTTTLTDLRVVVDRIEGRSVCGLEPGDCFTVTGSSQLSLPAGGHFCLYALAAVLPLLPAKQRAQAAGDWLAGDSEVACPDPEERLIMRIEVGEQRRYPTAELT
ncbi:MAG: TIGR04076 family protein [Actinomycetota bacterium]|nr:TIGR04076 family protein [Actinomycetota bacterium]